jgi:acetate kinase
MLLIEPRLNALSWTLDGTSDNLGQGFLDLNAGVSEELAKVFDLAGLDGVGYVLRHGGDVVRESISRLDENSLIHLEACISYAPEANHAILAAMRLGMQRHPERPQFLLCETALFSDLPAVARTCALPYELMERGVRRYGGDGLCHLWVLEELKARGVGGRLISVHLGDAPSIAALREGQPVETSLGFAASEHIQTAEACGDLDPSVTLLLREQGFSLAETTRLLDHESGWRALAGRACGLEDVLRGQTPPFLLAKDLLEATLVKEIGAGMAALGGAETLSFCVNDPQTAMLFIERICHRLEFAGATFRPAPLRAGNFWVLSLPGAPMQIVALSYDRHVALNSLLQAVAGG